MYSIRTIDLNKSFYGAEVVKNLDLKIKRSSFTSLVGLSGCGKTTILRLMAGLIEPTSGKVLINNVDGAEEEGNIGFIFQESSLFFWRSVRDNVSFPLEVAKKRLSRKDMVDKVDQVIELVGLSEFGDKLPHQLSGGMKQKVALARALVTDPEIIMMDEPLASIDEFSRDALNNEILNIWKRLKPTILLVTHSLREAVYLSQEVVVLSGPPAMVKKIIKTGGESSFREKIEEVRYSLGLTSNF